MALLLIFFYAGVLATGGLGAWVLRPRPSPGLALIRWVVVLFPMLLASTFLLKPEGPDFWLRWLPRPSLWDRVPLLAALALVTIRGLWNMVDVAVGWARLRHETIGGDALSGAPWLGYQTMCLRVGIPPPEIRLHRALRTPMVAGWRYPVILFPARLVPAARRDADPFWDEVGEAGGDPALIQAMLFHELEHVRRRDHVRLALLVLNGAVLPWEWIDGRAGCGTDDERRPRFLHWLSPLIRALGQPFRWGIQAERRIQEDLADAAVRCHMKDGQGVLERARGPTSPAGPGELPWMNEAWRALVFSLVTGGILGLAPGFATIQYAWEGEMTRLLDLPETWSLALEPGFGSASAGLLPGKGRAPGKILVHIKDLVPGHPPQLTGAGHFSAADLPGEGRVALTWDILMEGAPAKQEKLSMLFAAFRMVLDTRQESVTVEADATAPPEPLGGNRYRFRRYIDLGIGQQGCCWLYLRYVFQGKGRWAFDPPVIEIVTPDGHRQPFPSA